MTSKRVHFKSHENDSTNSNNSSGGSNSSNNLITVGVRVRPLNDKEKAQGNHNSIKINERNNEITINDKQNKLNSFTCDFIITDQTSSSTSYQSNSIQDNQQQYVYDQVGKPLLDRAFDGYNVSIFAYGQTGSGKTYSMIGTSGQPGLIPRFFDELFKKKQQRDQIVSSTHIEFSYYEIYNEKIYDLLGSTPQPSISNSSNKSNQIGSSPMVVGNATGTSNSRSLQIRENPNTGPYIVGLLTLSASSAADAKLWLDIGNKRRATACTNMNQKSSRSHSVFQINLTQMLEHSNLPPQAKQQQQRATTTTGNSLLQLVTSKINLVDLAGSERINTAFGSSNNTSNSYSSFASSNTSNQSRFKESTCINKSLLTLGKIICLLSDREISSSTASITNNKYLPYRESVLTWLLKESLGGNAKTAMLATVNSSSFFLDETLCTLRYAAKTACIKNEACLNRNFRQKYIDEFGRECEMNLIMPPMTTSMTGLPIHGSRSATADALEKSNELELTIKQMEKEWKEKLEEAERLKQKEINDLEKSLIVLYENETRAQNCCLINLNEDPSLSEKLIYLLKSQSTNKENNEETTATLVGSDKNLVNIHLTGPLIASVHCRIICKCENALMNYYIEQIDKNYVTYLNGEVIDGNKKIFKQLFHGDRIIFGGSHFFRFNNPLSNNLINNSKQTLNTNLNDNFKDYQFAKNEIERKQNEIIESKLSEALNKCKQDGDLKIKELEKKYEKNIENIKNELEKEKQAKKIELELIKTESHQKLKQIVQKKILIETKLNAIESDVANTHQELDKHEKNIIEDSLDVSSSIMRTPLANNLSNRRFINKLNEFSSAKKNPALEKYDIIQSHTNASSLFAITLSVTETNKICGLIGLEYEFKRHEILDSIINQIELDSTVKSSESSLMLKKHEYIQAISVIDKNANTITLWNLDKFEHKLSILRDIYSRIIEDEEENLTQTSTSISEYQSMIFDSTDEWQTLDKFEQNDENFSPKIIENAFSRNDRNQSCKRQLSMCSNESIMSNRPSDSTALSDEIHYDATDSSSQYSIKRKCLNSHFKAHSNVKLMPPPTPLSSIKTSKSFESDLTQATESSIDLVKHCNSFFYSKCRDLLDDLIQSDDEDLDNNNDEENIDTNKKIPKFDDVYLKYYLNIAINLSKLYCALFQNNHQIKQSLNFEDDQTNRNENSTNEHTLYAFKIINLFSHLNQFKPDYTNTIQFKNNRTKQISIIYSKIKKQLRNLKEEISSLYQSFDETECSNSAIKSKYENLLDQLKALIKLHGEYMFLTCANTFLISHNSFNIIEKSYLIEYVNGIDKQYEAYLKAQILNYENCKEPIADFIVNMDNFRMNCKTFKFLTPDTIIDYCNYVFQSNYRLTNAIRYVEKEKETNQNYCEQILSILYSILTDSLALNKISNTDIDSESIEKRSIKEADEMFKLTFKEIKTYYKNKHN